MIGSGVSRRQFLMMTGGMALGMATGLRSRPASAALASSYELFDLGVTAPADAVVVKLTDMNVHGVAVGNLYVDAEKLSPWVYQNGKLTRIKTGRYGATVACINDAGVIGGRDLRGWHNELQPFGAPALWIDGEKEVLAYPDGLPSPAEEGRVLGINNANVAVGMVSISGGLTFPVIWRDGNPDLLPMPPGNSVGFAQFINESGLIMGDVTAEQEGGGTFWTEAGYEFLAFSSPGRVNENYSMMMLGLDDQNRVLGSLVGPAMSEAAHYTYGAADIELLPTQPGDEASVILCSDGGSSFGGAVTIGGKEQAALWDGSERIELKSLVKNTRGLRLTEVRRMTPDGVLGGSAIDGDGALHAFVAVPA